MNLDANNPLAGLRIWQQNLNNSLTAQLSLINGPIADQWDVLALQEPAFDRRSGLTKANSHWRVVYPTIKHMNDSRPRAISFVNSKLSTNNWKQIPFPSRDVVIIQFMDTLGNCTIINIYNDGKSNLVMVASYLSSSYLISASILSFTLSMAVA